MIIRCGFIESDEDPSQQNLVVMGYRQAVRHSTLTAAYDGSNPASPVSGGMFRRESTLHNLYGILAQVVEHLTFNQVVGGSNPPCLILLKIA